ncbi:hypothetical protein B0J13DRAFT_607645 [Dactylonectria estremocensis]|uniref:Uncharacterized protein n=1 Tax=Dactylonectria estremocensis TaxID=1079267 RepID=A0A9P9EUL9_9HYPO|nr:hypothetical protein B0J13DRAFT_607645 [Dactylonectria estremocensis]
MRSSASIAAGIVAMASVAAAIPAYQIDYPGDVATTTTPVAAQTTAYSAPSDDLTTSTVYDTKVYTVTSCAPTVTNCPVGHVTTETVGVYTTVCPVSEQLTVSTVYTTDVHTITSCAPTVTNCPVGHVTTETVVVGTTVCPVSEYVSHSAPAPPVYTKPVYTSEWVKPGNNGTASTTVHYGVPTTPGAPVTTSTTPAEVPASAGSAVSVSGFLAAAGAAVAFFGLL